MAFPEFKKYSLWCFTFIAFCLIYGLFADPTPELISLVTILSAGFMLVSLSPQYFLKSDYTVPEKIGFLLFIICSIYPILSGIFSGHEPLLILRDLIPYLFIFIGFLFLPYFFNEPEGAIKIVLSGILIIAMTLSLRRLGVLHYGIERETIFQDPYALSIVPEILFAAVFIATFSILNFLSDKSLSQKLLMLIMCCVALLPMLAVMNISVMRAAIGTVLVATALSLFFVSLNRPLVGISLILGFSLLFVFFMQPLIVASNLFWLKTIMIGSNNRILEWEAVFDVVMSNPVTFLFGQGWGASLVNPAVGSTEVLYTHSLLSSSLLKGGFILMSALSLYFLWLLTGIFRRILSEKTPFKLALCLAVFLTLLVNIFIYGGYKTIGFGLVATLAIAMVACYGQSLTMTARNHRIKSIKTAT